jgi:hypothetical protein
MPIYLKDLVARVPSEVEAEVALARNRTRATLQEALRAECRLVLRPSEDSERTRSGVQVPVEVAPGYPAILSDVEFPDDLELALLVGRFRTACEQASAGAQGLLRLREQLLCREDSGHLIGATMEQLQATADWAERLLKLLGKHDPLQTVLAVREDWLGVYQYDAQSLFHDEYYANRATISLYWGVIGLTAEWMGCSVHDLTVVVLAHELAHAYTQLGADIEGRRWPAPDFAAAEAGLVEGLAQYYTERVLCRLENRFEGALNVYRRMLPGQPEDYRTHQPWVEQYSPEVIRRAMLEVRRWRQGGLAEFSQRLAEARAGLNPE